MLAREVLVVGEGGQFYEELSEQQPVEFGSEEYGALGEEGDREEDC